MTFLVESVTVLCIVDCVVCQVFGDEADMYKIEDVQIQDLGKVGEITITKDDCLLMKVSCSILEPGVLSVGRIFHIFCQWKWILAGYVTSLVCCRSEAVK